MYLSLIKCVCRKKYKTEGHLVVAVEGNRELTLRDLFETELGFTAHEASVDHLNVHALGMRTLEYYHKIRIFMLLQCGA